MSREVVHYERKDLMRKVSVRLSFMLILTCRLWMLCQRSEEIVATAAKWGHKAVAITDHGMSVPFLAIRRLESEIQLISMDEANIVEDRVPIIYNSEVDLSSNLRGL